MVGGAGESLGPSPETGVGVRNMVAESVGP